MRHILLSAAVTVTLLAQQAEHPSGKRTTPPTLTSVQPFGVSRGTTVEMTIEGLNLAAAQAIYFSEPGITGKILRVKELPDLPDIRLGSNGTPSTIDLGPLPPRNQVTVEVDVSPDADIGPVSFRLHTPLGTGPAGSFLIEPYYGESPDREPNDTPENAFETFLPTILTGAISRSGDVDYYKIAVKAGEELVFENSAAQIGSSLQPVVTLLDADQAIVREFGTDGGTSAGYFSHRFEKAGTYYLRVSDYQQSGRAGHFYRIKAGQFPLATRAYPLGLERGKTRPITIQGFNLGSAATAVTGTASPEDPDAVLLRPATPAGNAFNRVRLALGDAAEVESTGVNTSLASAQPVQLPVTVNGRLKAPHFFRFTARKGQKLVFEVMARRLGSELDSAIEVTDASGRQIERATVRAVQETILVLRDHDSSQRGLRVQAWLGWNVGDYVLIGGEVLRIEALPRGPDDDMIFESFGGQRIAYFNTSTEAHAADKAVHKAQIHPPGARFSPNGLPLVRLYYQNDDGGPGYGKDSLVHFTAPADGDYIVKLRDVRGQSGDDYAYRLMARAPRPDFRLAVTPRNPNVPLGGAVPLTVTALRIDEFDGPIEVSVPNLPPGLHATTGVIAPGQISTTLLLSADSAAKLERAAPLGVAGKARIGGQEIARAANPEDKLKLISLMPKPDIMMTAETREVTIEGGGTAEVRVSIARQNEFGGRVPVEIRNLPPQVRVIDVGLNGVLINEDESRRTFTLEALPWASGLEQLIYVAGTVETRSNLPSSYAALQPILLKVKPNPGIQAAGRDAGTSARGSAPK